jgi:1,4-alpha-glucan branching enzyme
VITFIRKGHDEINDIIVACNFSFISRNNYRIGLPGKGHLKQILSSDFKKYFGGGMSNAKEIKIEKKHWDERDYSAEILLPPLGIVIFKIK